MFSVYMPYDSSSSSFTDYLNTLGEIHGLINANPYSGVFLVGDFNVDFDRSGPLTKLLSDFMLELDTLSVDYHRSCIMNEMMACVVHGLITLYFPSLALP